MLPKTSKFIALRSEQKKQCKALLHDVLNWFLKRGLAREPQNGVNGRPTEIEMPEEGKNTVAFQNHHKHMKVLYMIYADFEALVRKIHRCEREEGIKASYTEQTEQH